MTRPTGLICIDVGTTSLRAVLFDADGRTRHVAHRHNPPGYHENGRVEQDAECWQRLLPDALAEAAQAAQAAALPPACLAVTSQRSSVLAVDGDGRPLHPVLMWQDTRSSGLVQAMSPVQQAEVYARAGLHVSPVFSAPKMAWLREQRPQVWSRAHRLLGVHDWVLWLLTGRQVTDHSFGSRTALMNLGSRDWDDDLLALFGVPRRMLCELVPPGTVVGHLGEAMATAAGLPAGLPVVSAGGDQQCAALGLGLLGPGRAVANVGTGCYLIAHADGPVLDPQRRVSCNVSALPGACIVEASILAAGAAHGWMVRLAGGSESEAAFAAVEAEAAAAPPGANGVLVLPEFCGAGTPHWDPSARAAIVNLRLDSTRGDIARALLEGLAMELRDGLDVVESLTAPVAAVRAAGGLTRSPLFDRILADVLERPLECDDDAEATAHGAWIAAAVAIGLYADAKRAYARLAQRTPGVSLAPDEARRALYRSRRAEARNIYAALAAARGRPAGAGTGEA